VPADVLVIGYGNTLRGDDGLGPAVAADVARLGWPGVRVKVVHQLTPELAADLADARRVVFVDAAIGGEPVTAVRIETRPAGDVMSHAADPRGLLTLCGAVYGTTPDAWLVTVAGADFDFRDGLSPTARENARAAQSSVEALIREASCA
jgi:hydrogenase maturation protease